MTPNAFRRIALALDGAIESAHHGHPDFRVGGTSILHRFPYVLAFERRIEG